MGLSSAQVPPCGFTPRREFGLHLGEGARTGEVGGPSGGPGFDPLRISLTEEFTFEV